MTHFGVDIEAHLDEWIQGEFSAVIRKKYGKKAKFTLVILSAKSRRLGTEWLENAPHPELGDIVITFGGEDEDHTGPQGLINNVSHKIEYCLDTGMNSGDAWLDLGGVEPGHYIYDGAGWFLNELGGVSGLEEESDWWVYTRCVRKYRELRAAAASPMIELSRDAEHRVGDEKYLVVRGDN